MAELEPTNLIELIDRYFDQSIGVKEHAELSRRLEQSASERALFVRMSDAYRSCRDWARFETEMRDSQVTLPDLEESRKIDEEVWQSILQDSIRAKHRAEIEQKALQIFEEDQRLARLSEMNGKRGRSNESVNRMIVIPRMVVWGALAAVLLLMGLIVIQSMPTHETLTPTASQLSDPSVPPTTAPYSAIHVASASETVDAVWSQQHQLPRVDKRMLPGRYAIERGAVGIDMQRGASLVIQAPCVFELVNDNRIRVYSGRVYAKVPQQATGFTVMAGGLQIIDLGTEFGVDVDDSGRVMACVVKGAVALREDDDITTAVTLIAGESIDVPQGSELADAQKTFDPGPLAMFARSVKEAADPFLRYRQAVLEGRPLLYWDFESVTTDRVIPNMVEPGRFDGVIRGPVRLSVGQIGKAGVFNGDNTVQCDVVSSDSLFSGEKPGAYTFQAWVRLDRVQKSSIAALFQRDDSELAEHKHGMHMDLNGQGQAGQTSALLRFIHRAPVAEQSQNDTRLQGDIVMQQDRWVLLTAVKDRQEIRVYADGVLLSSAEDSQGVDGPIQLAIGSPGVGLQANRDNYRTFAGQIDEVAVYDYALSAEQINNYFNLGQPRP